MNPNLGPFKTETALVKNDHILRINVAWVWKFQLVLQKNCLGFWRLLFKKNAYLKFVIRKNYAIHISLRTLCELRRSTMRRGQKIWRPPRTMQITKGNVFEELRNWPYVFFKLQTKFMKDFFSKARSSEIPSLLQKLLKYWNIEIRFWRW